MDYELIIDKDGVEHVLIDNGDGSFTSMTKTHFDELEAAKEAQSLQIVESMRQP